MHASESTVPEEETISEFEMPKLEEPVQPTITEEPPQTTEKAEVTQPEVHASETTTPEEEIVSELETPKLEEPVQPTVIEEPKDAPETVEETQPEVSDLENEMPARVNFEKDPKFNVPDHAMKHKTYDAKLPATGYANHMLVTLLGMMLLIISGLGVYYSKK